MLLSYAIAPWEMVIYVYACQWNQQQYHLEMRVELSVSTFSMVMYRPLGCLH